MSKTSKNNTLKIGEWVNINGVIGKLKSECQVMDTDKGEIVAGFVVETEKGKFVSIPTHFLNEYEGKEYILPTLPAPIAVRGDSNRMVLEIRSRLDDGVYEYVPSIEKPVVPLDLKNYYHHIDEVQRSLNNLFVLDMRTAFNLSDPQYDDWVDEAVQIVRDNPSYTAFASNKNLDLFEKLFLLADMFRKIK